jgi:adenylate cyclase
VTPRHIGGVFIFGLGYRDGVPRSARDWLIEGAPGAATSPAVLAGTCERLIEAGVPVVRAEAYVRTLHPQFAGRGFVWSAAGGVRVIEAQHAVDLEEASSPIQRVFESHELVRQKTDAGEVAAFPLRFTTGDVHAVAFTTVRPGGFGDAEIAALGEVVAPLSRMAEILALKRTAANVLTAYVGRDAGARVLAGKIRRGDTERIEAAIWFSDMRGFSTVSNHMSPGDVIAMLNELFDCQLPAIERYGGEVLKFMGDGLLAIFTPSANGLRECCERALRASRDACTAAAVRNLADARSIKFGIALHVGEVAYGNIGGEWRLDFTCIGRAVNLAARLESVTAQTGHDVLASADFAARLGEAAFERIGEYTVKGFAEPIAAFAPLAR